MTALTISPTQTETPQPPRRNRQPMGRRVMRAVRRLPVWILVTLLLIVVLYPQLWMVLGSFKTQAEFLSRRSTSTITSRRSPAATSP